MSRPRRRTPQLPVQEPRVTPPAPNAFHDGFDTIRRELDITEAFPAEALEELESPQTIPDRAGRAPLDHRDIPFVTIDPAGSRDLDQAYHAERSSNGGYRVSYAIADPASFVPPGGALDHEIRRRGVTMYGPDHHTPLHPPQLSEGSASLLPDLDRPAVVWTIDLDDAGRRTAARLERAMVRSRAQLSYVEAQNLIDRDEGPESLHLLRELGRLRHELEVARGGVSLNLPSQEVVATADGYELVYDEALPVEDWNAHISLLTGMAAADLMLNAGVGLLRTLPPPPSSRLLEIRRHGEALGVHWPPEVSYQQQVRTLDPAIADHAALLSFAVRALRGAGYLALDGPTEEPTIHWAIGADYAHVTAPLRRVGDRFANECLLAICADEAPPEWAAEGVMEMPKTLGAATRRERSFERAVVDLVEAVVMAPRIGDRFHAVVTSRRRDDQVVIQLREPAVTAVLDAPVEPGDEIVVVLREADPAERRVRFELAD